MPTFLTELEPNRFLGACFDTGATKSVIGREQAEAYCSMMGCHLNLTKEGDKNTFCFGKHRVESIGTLEIVIPLIEKEELHVVADVVDINIPFLLGLDILDQNKLYVNNVKDMLVSDGGNWSHGLKRKFGHIYLDWEPPDAWTKDLPVFYSDAELSRIHRHFFHPHPSRLYKLMKRADDPRATPEVLRKLEELYATCDVCQRLAKEPGRLRVSLPRDDIVFNRTLLLDLMTLAKSTVLHIVDKDTNLSAATFLPTGEKSKDVWEALLRIWVRIYVGYPDVIHDDQGPQFQSATWKTLLATAGIKQVDSGVQSHNALGAGETYHRYLREIFHKVTKAEPRLSHEDALATAVHAMNSTAGPEGLSPILLVFGVNPRMPVNPANLPVQRARMHALAKARQEMMKQISRRRLSTARRSNVPRAVNNDVRAGMDVLVYREAPENEWVGPHKVIAVDHKQVWIFNGSDIVLLSIDKVKPYQKERPAASIAPAAQSEPIPQSIADEFEDAVDAISSDAHFHQLKQRLVGYVVKHYPLTPEAQSDSAKDVHMSKVLALQDPLQHSKPFMEAKKAEIDGILKRKVFKKVKTKSIPANANIVGGRFTCTLKNHGTADERPKARYIAQCHNDREKPFIVHDIPTLRQSATKVIVSTASTFGFRIYSHDVTQAYLQSKDELTRVIYLRPKKEDRALFNLQEDEILQIVKPLYGICDSGDYWGITLLQHVEVDLGMRATTGDPSLFYRTEVDLLQGLLGSYADDCLLAGGPKFQKLTEKTIEKFESRPRVWDNVEFLGVNIVTKHLGEQRHFEMHQTHFLENIQLLPLDASFREFSSTRASFAWLSHTRPDLCCIINRAAQVTEKTFEVKQVKQLNAGIRYARKTKEIVLRYEALERDTLHLRVFSDASFASNEDFSSQIGYIVMLCDGNNRCHILSYSSKKSRRVVRSIMAGEVYAFTEAFDVGFITKYDLEQLYRTNIPLTMFTDSKQLFDVMTKASHSSEKRLMIDIAAARQAYKAGDISNVGLVSSDWNVADGQTKPGICAALRTVMETGYNEVQVNQWIIRLSS